ncbi:MAG: DNA mismatch repair protein MutS [Cellulosilyticaceae bacterium]
MNVTPMMRQYLDIKERHQDCILFFRLGDFYEMFFDDALTATRELEITLTGRECGLEERAPMCGVPFHSADNYISRLVEKGYKVAICEQVEEAGLGKGLVKRDVVRIVTPGTILEGSTMQEGKNNYIVSIVDEQNRYGLSICDVSTGEWHVTEVVDYKKLLDELAKFVPVECILSSNLYGQKDLYEFLTGRFNATLSEIPSHCLDREVGSSLLQNHFNILKVEGIGLSSDYLGTLAAASLLHYLQETQKNSLSHLNKINIYNVDEFMLLDLATRRNLELTETLREKKRKGSLLWVLDYTKTAMGARYLRKCIEQPLIDANQIKLRLEATEELTNQLLLKDDLMEHLDRIYDMERLVGKIAYGTCNAKEMVALKQSLEGLPAIYEILAQCQSQSLKAMYEQFDPLRDLYDIIDQAIVDDAPISLREGGLIKAGYSLEVDQLREVKLKGTDWLRDIEAQEREKTGIKNLKIKYNKVFGYFLEVTNSYSGLVPEHFIRKQTLSNCERYITEELKKIEEQVLGADDKLQALEYNLFTGVRDNIASHIKRLLQTSQEIAQLDMFCSLAHVAYTNNYIKPTITSEDTIYISAGRHPVVENIVGTHTFISNDVLLDNDTNQINLITGPNMAGKSTYMRQVALIVLMAQIGSFVPAEAATIGVVDRIFTRVGASDDLASGQSTFMVEMMEMANILHNATQKSLLILDEIGRGTSTIDGLSIAWAIIEHIANRNILGAKTLFATHYHELTTLTEKINGIKNYCVSVKEIGEDIIFLHKIIEGSVDHSYGVQVAKLAGLPDSVLKRAREIMTTVENDQQGDMRRTIAEVASVEAEEPIQPEPIKEVVSDQLSLFSNVQEDVILELKKLDILGMTPLDAIQTLYTIQKRLKE